MIHLQDHPRCGKAASSRSGTNDREGTYARTIRLAHDPGPGHGIYDRVDRARPMCRAIPGTGQYSPADSPAPAASRAVASARRTPGRRRFCATIPPPRQVQLPRQPSATAPAPSLEAELLTSGTSLKSAPLEPSDVRFPINLATALRLSDARPLIVAAAQASVWVAEAQLTRAKVLWVPTFMAGADYVRHDGGGPDFNKGIMTAPA